MATGVRARCWQCLAVVPVLAVSGALSLAAVPARADTPAASIALAHQVGCADDTTLLACMRGMPVASILEAETTFPFNVVGPVVTWAPETGGPLLPDAPAQAFDTGAYNRVPVLLGSNSSDIPGLGCQTQSQAASLSRWAPTYRFEFADETAPPLPGRPPQVAGHGAQHSAELEYLYLFSVQGDVGNAHALVSGGTATLTAKPGGTAPLIVLDYDQIVGGQPQFLVSKVTGDVTLQAIYSQSLPYLLPAGDGPAPDNPVTNDAAEQTISFVGDASGAQQSRVENYRLTRPGLVQGHLLQAGQRFQAITLLGSGSIQIGRVGFTPSFRLDTPEDQRRVALDVTIPANTTAEIWVPGSGHPVTVGPGTYRFNGRS